MPCKSVGAMRENRLFIERSIINVQTMTLRCDCPADWTAEQFNRINKLTLPTADQLYGTFWVGLALATINNMEASSKVFTGLRNCVDGRGV